jgi:hypothetical protein
MSVRFHDRKPWYHWLKWGDFLLYGVITLAALALMLQWPGRTAASGQGEAQIVVKGTVVQTFSASKLQAGGGYSFEANGYHYKVVFENGRIRFSEADCPDRVCVRTGWISHQGQLAACVPGEVILRIEGQTTSGTTNDVDVIIR